MCRVGDSKLTQSPQDTMRLHLVTFEMGTDFDLADTVAGKKQRNYLANVPHCGSAVCEIKTRKRQKGAPEAERPDRFLYIKTRE